MLAVFLQRNPKLLTWLFHGWVFWLGYGFLPLVLTLQLEPLGSSVTTDSALGLLSFRLLMLVCGYFLLSSVEKTALKKTLFQQVALPNLFKILGLFGTLIVSGIVCFTWVEQCLQLPLQQTVRELGGVASVGQVMTVVVLAPIVEESWFRYWLLAGDISVDKRQKQPLWGFIYGGGDIASVVLFGLLHVSLDYWGLKSFIWALVMGLFLVWIRRSTGSLTACICFHALHNGVMFLKV